MQGISKRYQGVQALDDASLDVQQGEVMCLLGENGAGKSTLIKILTGSVTPDSGVIELGGEFIEVRSPLEAVRRGISVVHQELDLVPDQTVAQNLYIGREPSRFGIVDTAQRRRQAADALERVGAHFSPNARVRDLTVVQRQLTMIARALTVNARVLVMDEPSATLTAEELSHVFTVVREVASGGCSVLYISHRMEEVFEIGNRATVMRDGRTVAVHDLASVTQDGLIAEMLGDQRTLVDRPLRDGSHTIAGGLDIKSVVIPGVLEISGITAPRGQVTGLIGLGGSGRSTLLSALFGTIKAQRDVTLDGRAYHPHSPRSAISQKVGLVPEDRKSQGLMINRSVWNNLIEPSLNGRRTMPSPRRFTTPRKVVSALGVRLSSLTQRVRELSGGNQQKVVLGKWLVDASTVLLLDEPTRGLDVGAKADLFDEVHKLADSGTCVLLASSELPEVFANCDTIHVLYEGRLAGSFRPGSNTVDQVLQAMLGVKGAQ